MRRDAWLTLALISQVILAVFLTGWLWMLPFGRQVLPMERASVTQVPSGGFVSVPSLVRPARFIAHWPDGTLAMAPAGTFEYDWLWEEMRALLASGAVVRPMEWQPDSGAGLEGLWGKTPIIDVEMAGSLPMGEWAQQWGGGLGETAHDQTPVDRIIVVLGQAPAIYFLGPAGTWRGPGLSSAQQEGILEWLQRVERRDLTPYRPFKMPGGLEGEPGLAVPAQLPGLLPPRIQVKPPSPSDLEASIFPDLSVVREISEGDGAFMYTDGQKYLRLNPDGAVEYRAPELSTRVKAPGLAHALTLAAEFVAEHGGWPPGLMLTEVSQAGGQTALTFSRAAGRWPVVSTEPLLRVEVSGERVVSFYRLASFGEVLSPRGKAGGVQAVEPESALVAWRARYQRRNVSILRGVYFAYAFRDGELTPVWCFTFASAPTVIIDARTGESLP